MIRKRFVQISSYSPAHAYPTGTLGSGDKNRLGCKWLLRRRGRRPRGTLSHMANIVTPCARAGAAAKRRTGKIRVEVDVTYMQAKSVVRRRVGPCWLARRSWLVGVLSDLETCCCHGGDRSRAAPPGSVISAETHPPFRSAGFPQMLSWTTVVTNQGQCKMGQRIQLRERSRG